MNEEVSKNLGKLAFNIFAMVTLTVISVKVQRAVAKPDFGRVFAMRRVWTVKRFADGQVKFWQEVAGTAANRYNALKP